MIAVKFMSALVYVLVAGLLFQLGGWLLVLAWAGFGLIVVSMLSLKVKPDYRQENIPLDSQGHVYRFSRRN